MILVPGLVSVTFRSLTPGRIVALAAETGLQVIEWGGDVHVPPGELKRAHEVAELCRDAGIGTSAYGSYYRLGDSKNPKKNESINGQQDFQRNLETAVALGAPRIRVWAGEKGSAETSPDQRERIVREARSIAKQTASFGITVCFEYHENSLTDTDESARALLREVNHPGVNTYWQPPVGSKVEENVAALREILDVLGTIHVTQRDPQGRRLPLAEGRGEWMRYLEAASEKPGPAPLPVMLEFLAEESPEQLSDDAAVLRELLRELG